MKPGQPITRDLIARVEALERHMARVANTHAFPGLVHEQDFASVQLRIDEDGPYQFFGPDDPAPDPSDLTGEDGYWVFIDPVQVINELVIGEEGENYGSLTVYSPIIIEETTVTLTNVDIDYTGGELVLLNVTVDMGGAEVFIIPNSPPGTPTPGSLYVDTGDLIVNLDGDLFTIAGPGAAAGVVSEVEVTVTHTQLQTAADSNNIDVYTLPARGVILHAVLKTTTAFAITGGTSYQLRLGNFTSSDHYVDAYDAMTSVTDTNIANGTAAANPGIGVMNDYGTARAVKLYANSDVNLNNSTAGAVKVHLLVWTP